MHASIPRWYAIICSRGVARGDRVGQINLFVCGRRERRPYSKVHQSVCERISSDSSDLNCLASASAPVELSCTMLSKSSCLSRFNS